MFGGVADVGLPCELKLGLAARWPFENDGDPGPSKPSASAARWQGQRRREAGEARTDGENSPEKLPGRGGA
jgi:hypothetical protein